MLQILKAEKNTKKNRNKQLQKNENKKHKKIEDRRSKRMYYIQHGVPVFDDTILHRVSQL